MKGGNKLFLFAGVGLALVAVLLGITMSSGGGSDNPAGAQDQEQASPTKIMVVRLLQDIEQHQVIQAEMIETVEMDSALAPPNPVTVAANVVNQSYTLKASTGDILRQEFVAPPGITASIEPGMRAISLGVDAQGAMSGLVVAGDYIDVVFEARVSLRRVLELDGVVFEEDGPYSLDTFLPTDPSPFQGKDGGEFTAVDGGDLLEPVAKMLVQDVKIIRVIPVGTTYDGQGQQVQTGEESGPSTDDRGQLIVEVTPQQAEAIAFKQSEFHAYSIAVRGKDDHAAVQTTGVTFQILMTDGTWSLPWPEPIVAEDALENRGAPAETAATPAADEETT